MPTTKPLQFPFRRTTAAGKNRLAALSQVLACLLFPVLAAGAALAGGDRNIAFADDLPGSGNGHIHIMPTMSAVSLKNGEQATIQAVVRAEAGAVSVEARIDKESGNAPEPVDTLSLAPAPANLGGMSTDATVGLWQSEWTAHSLEEAWYRVAITVTDHDGRVYTDRSLRFSDPIAGNDTVGTTDYLNAGMARMDAVDFFGSAHGLSSAVIDAAEGYAYFGTFESPAQVVKVALGEGSGPPERVGTLTLEDGESHLWSAVIDPQDGHAYFGTFAGPGQVVKVALGEGDDPPRRVGAVTLESGEDWLQGGVIDPAGGHAYFGTHTSPARVVKVALGENSAPPQRVGAVELADGEEFIRGAVIDPQRGHAYFGTETSPGRIVKVALGEDSAPPQRVGAVTLESGENSPMAAVIDAAGGHAYFGTRDGGDDPGSVVKILLREGFNAPERVGAVTLESGEHGLVGAVIDPEGGHAYFGTSTDPGRVVKVALGQDSHPPERVGAVTVPVESSGWGLFSAAIDPEGGHAYFGTNTVPGAVAKVALGQGSNPPQVVETIVLESEEDFLPAAVIDVAGGHAYFGTSGAGVPGRVVKVALGDGKLRPQRMGAVTLESTEAFLRSAVIDPAAGHAYFGTGAFGVPGRVIKVALGEGPEPPERIGALTLENGEEQLQSAVIDPEGGHAYFGTNTSPGRVVKVALGQGDALPQRIGAVELDSGENFLRSAVIDPANGHAYFGTSTSPGQVVKVVLGPGSTLPQRASALTLDSGENFLSSAIIDTAGGHAYFGTNTSPGQVVKIALEAGSAPPTRVGAIELESGEVSLSSAVIDPDGGHAYFGTAELGDVPGRVVKVALGEGSASPQRVGALTLGSGEESLQSAVINAEAGRAYFGTSTEPGRVVRVGLSHKGFVKGTRLVLPEEGEVESLSFASHQAEGNVRLALYDTSADPTLLWQSDVAENTATGDWLTIPVENGTPSALVLPADEYWLAWQIDTAANVPSYTAGGANEGLLLPHAWGDFPPLLETGTPTKPTFTNDRWSAYLTYDTDISPTPWRVVGDLNNSGCVGFADFVILLENWDESWEGIPLGFPDFVAMLENWGTGPNCP